MYGDGDEVGVAEARADLRRFGRGAVRASYAPAASWPAATGTSR